MKEIMGKKGRKMREDHEKGKKGREVEGKKETMKAGK